MKAEFNCADKQKGVLHGSRGNMLSSLYNSQAMMQERMQLRPLNKLIQIS